MDIERQDKIVNIVQQNVEKVQERTAIPAKEKML